MKRNYLTVIFIFLLQALLFSCKKEIPAARRLDEKWQLERIIYDYYNPSGELTYSDSEISRSESYILLFADLKFDLFYDRELTQGTYTLGNNLLNLSFLKPSSNGIRKDTTVVYTISKKSSSQFIFFNEKLVSDGKEKATLYFKREY
ncbi:hypothetical protein [Daejeonella oryzae]|uniref:hypothetical protein n=1 Tax=Daejeonella oryzae TaxID=1122943 RepID=UPI0004101484|nr:hypothetical protein [Daejeonella oryzae]